MQPTQPCAPDRIARAQPLPPPGTAIERAALRGRLAGPRLTWSCGQPNCAHSKHRLPLNTCTALKHSMHFDLTAHHLKAFTSLSPLSASLLCLHTCYSHTTHLSAHCTLHPPAHLLTSLQLHTAPLFLPLSFLFLSHTCTPHTAHTSLCIKERQEVLMKPSQWLFGGGRSGGRPPQPPPLEGPEPSPMKKAQWYHTGTALPLHTCQWKINNVVA